MSGASLDPTPAAPLDADLFHALTTLGTCAISNAVEATGLRLRNEGFMDGTVRCLFPELPPLMGYAFTLGVRTTKPRVRGQQHPDTVEWAHQLELLPKPRVLVVQDLENRVDTGSVMGEVHAHMFRALGCVGAITNGAVRDLPELQTLGFGTFASHVSVSHAYVHLVSIGAPVMIGGLTVRTGDLLCGDMHGVISVPDAVAADLPEIAARQRRDERRIIDYCAASSFSVDGLEQLLRQIQAQHPLPE